MVTISPLTSIPLSPHAVSFFRHPTYREPVWLLAFYTLCYFTMFKQSCLLHLVYRPFDFANVWRVRRYFVLLLLWQNVVNTAAGLGDVSVRRFVLGGIVKGINPLSMSTFFLGNFYTVNYVKKFPIIEICIFLFHVRLQTRLPDYLLTILSAQMLLLILIR